MADENVELARDTYDAFNRGDLEAVLAVVDPEIEIRDPDRTGQVHRGPEGFLRFIGDWMESWDEYKIEVVELTPNGDFVFADLVQHGVGKGSGIEFSQQFWQVLRFRDGRITNFEVYAKRDDALRAARLAD